MRPASLALTAAAALTACHSPSPSPPPPPSPSPSPPPSPSPSPPPSPITLTYLGVAGWQLDAGAITILTDPYFSRPADPDRPLVPDTAAIAAHAPPRADLILIGHSHYDHLLDAPAVALRTGAQLLGSATTALVARASGVPADHLITIEGGEDLELDGYSIRVIPSLHSALGDKHVFGGALTAAPTLPMPQSGYQEGGTYGYLIRIAGHQILVLDTANFIERELDGLRPDIAILAGGLRGEIHDYTCRLLHALGDPPQVFTTHFDAWKGPPVDAPIDDDLAGFVAEIHRCSPATTVTVPRHFVPIPIP